MPRNNSLIPAHRSNGVYSIPNQNPEAFYPNSQQTPASLNTSQELPYVSASIVNNMSISYETKLKETETSLIQIFSSFKENLPKSDEFESKYFSVTTDFYLLEYKIC